jgi:hypothetical protein
MQTLTTSENAAVHQDIVCALEGTMQAFHDGLDPYFNFFGLRQATILDT